MTFDSRLFLTINLFNNFFSSNLLSPKEIFKADDFFDTKYFEQKYCSLNKFFGNKSFHTYFEIYNYRKYKIPDGILVNSIFRSQMKPELDMKIYTAL